MGSKLRITVWGEYVHERKNAVVAEIYPNGMHQCIANGLSGDKTLDVRTATLDQPNHGLTEAVLDSTDVLLWWGHAAHGQVTDLVADAVVRRVWEGMGLIALHSGHYSKVFKRLMGTSCSPTWREAGEKERLWVCNPGHPIANGLDRYFEIPNTETFQSIRLASRSLRKARVFIRPARKAISENRGSHSHTRLI
jgi:trehalose utilization protein